MFRTTKDWKNIEIDTYSNEQHIRNICKKLKISWYNLLTIQECKEAINNNIEQRELLEDEVIEAQFNIY